jgi:hypothetical protein
MRRALIAALLGAALVASAAAVGVVYYWWVFFVRDALPEYDAPAIALIAAIPVVLPLAFWLGWGATKPGTPS